MRGCGEGGGAGDESTEALGQLRRKGEERRETEGEEEASSVPPTGPRRAAEQERSGLLWLGKRAESAAVDGTIYGVTSGGAGGAKADAGQQRPAGAGAAGWTAEARDGHDGNPNSKGQAAKDRN